jgi:PAS domain S-box-containing protein
MASERPGKFNGAGLDALLGQMRDAVAFVDPSGRLLMTNRTDESPVPSSPVAAGGPPDPNQIFRLDGRPYAPSEWPILRSVTDGEVVVDEDFFRVESDGGHRSFSCRSAPIYRDGTIVAAVLVTQDTTGGTRRKVALEDAQRRAVDILESIPADFVGLDENWGYTYVNQGGLRAINSALGSNLSAEDLVGRTVWDLFPGFADTTLHTELERARLERRPVVVEWHSEPEDRWMEVRAYPEKGGLSTYTRDITESRLADQALRQQDNLLDLIDDAVVGTDPEFRLTLWNRAAETLYGYEAIEVLGRDARDVASYPGDQSRLQLEQELLDTGRTRTEIVAYRKDGTSVEVELISVVVRNPDEEVSGYLGIHREITERTRERDELERRVRQQAVVARLGVKALEAGELKPLMNEAVALVQSTLEVEYAKVDQLLPGDQELLIVAGAGWREGVVGSVIPAGRGSPAGYAVMIGEPVIVDDMSAEGRFDVPAVLRSNGVMSDVTVVIDPRGHPFGALAAMSTKQRKFSGDDIGFMQAVANVLATGVERSEEGQRLDAAREAERNRIARDLHDEALRELTDAFALAVMARSKAAGPDDARRWGRLITALERVDEQLRNAIYDLRLGAIEGREFADLLGELITLQAEIAGDLPIQLAGLESLPTGSLGHRGTEVLRIVREAVINARRHSRATTIRVDAGGSTQGLLRIAVSDDGDWPDRATRADTGITGMLERADALGADLQIEGRPEGGTRVSVELALVRPDEENDGGRDAEATAR